jgi:pimeloyl-ACP methyl ester carboxylesterase
MSAWSDGIVSANGLSIHYYRTGGDKPVVVFNHGAGDDGLCWTRVVKELEADYDCIMVDGRGHGKTIGGKGDYSTAQRVADLASLVQALKLERPVVGGHSLGADTSMNFAATYPELTRAVFLEDPPILQPGQKFGDGTKEYKVEDLGKMMARFMRVFKIMPKFIAIPVARKMSPTYPDDEINPWVNSKKRVSSDFLNSMTSMDFESAAPLDVFKRIVVPVLLFIGDNEKMSIVSIESAQKASDCNAKVQVVHLVGASHDIRRTRFDGYVPALKDFLKNINYA